MFWLVNAARVVELNFCPKIRPFVFESNLKINTDIIPFWHFVCFLLQFLDAFQILPPKLVNKIPPERNRDIFGTTKGPNDILVEKIGDSNSEQICRGKRSLLFGPERETPQLILGSYGKLYREPGDVQVTLPLQVSVSVVDPFSRMILDLEGD